MKLTNANDLTNLFMEWGGKENGWTYAGAETLMEYLLEYENATDEEIEFDPVAFRADYSEMTGEEIYDSYGRDDETPEETLARVEYETTVLRVFDNLYIVQDY